MPKHNTDDVTLHPAFWLRELARLNPARWNLSRCTRAACAVALPMAIGYFTNTLMYTMWISMGALFPSIGERDAPYSATVKKLLVAAPLGASGFLLGYLNDWGLDWGWVVLAMTLIGFVLAIVSSYSAALSVGGLQFMVMAAVALGNPEIEHFGMSTLLLLGGTLFYLCLIQIEKWICPQNLRRDAIVQVLQALSAICQEKISGSDVEAARLQFSIKYEALYTLMLQTRYRALGRNQIVDQTAEVLQGLDRLFAALMAEQGTAQIQRLQTVLQDMTDALAHERSLTLSDPGASALTQALADVATALWGEARSTSPAGQPAPAALPLKMKLQKLTPGRTTVQSALKLGLCTALGYSVHFFDDITHWYWVPMTVGIVMKPELGSIFVRAVQRMAGTAVGVTVGGLLLALLPVGPIFISIIAAITFFLPWLSQRNYALTAFAVTPLVLVLIDFLSPERHGVDYAMLRLVDTLMGCAIVLVFGYLIWPRRHFSELDQAMTDARKGIAHYLREVLDDRVRETPLALNDARRAAYSKLVDMRAALQKSMAEPPPAGYEAAAWFPLVACAARLCDAITVYSASPRTAPDPQEWAWLQKMPQAIEGLEDLPALPEAMAHSTSAEARLILTLQKETETRQHLYERVDPRAHASA